MHRFSFLVTMVVTVTFFVAHEWSTSLPEVKPATVAAGKFSAERAMAILEEILGDGVPHPVGSAANKAVKSRIVSWLTRHDMQAEVQETWGCTGQWGRCGWVENIIVPLPGQEAGPSVGLMAHYDSVAPAPGAGDDGAGVAAIMEVARIIKAEGHRYPLLLIITDAEEQGLLGAEAFFREHPRAKELGVVLNVEGSGTTGRSLLLRTSMANATLIEAFGEVADHPYGSSMNNEIFERMPNDTDFSVARRAQVPGIDFAFAGERNHYHTAHDSIENLDPRTMQHHGENLLPLTRKLLNDGLAETDSYLVYGNQYGFWITWSRGITRVVLALCVAALLVASWKARWPQSPIRGALACLAPVAVLVSVTVSIGAVFFGLHLLKGQTPFWPAHDGPYRALLFSLPVLATLMVAMPFNKRFEAEELLLAVWWFIAVCTVALAIWVPDAVMILLLPLMVASAVLLASKYLAPKGQWLYQLALIVAIPGTLGSVLLLEASQGYWWILSTAPFFAFYSMAALPNIRGAHVKEGAIAAVAVVVVASGLVMYLPSFSEWRPQHLTFHAIENVSTAEAWLQPITRDEIPEHLQSQLQFDQQVRAFPWQTQPEEKLAPLPLSSEHQLPTLEVLSDARTVRGRELSVRIDNPRRAMSVGMAFPIGHGPSHFEIASVTHELSPLEWGAWQDVTALDFQGVQDRTIDITLIFADPSMETDKLWLYDTKNGLPEQLEYLVAARAPLATPVHRGDLHFVVQEVALR